MLTWIMFLKFLDDMEQVREAEAKLEGKRSARPSSAPYRWRDWAAKPDGITGDALIAFINHDEAIRPDGTKGPGLFAYLRVASGHERRRPPRRDRDRLPGHSQPDDQRLPAAGRHQQGQRHSLHLHRGDLTPSATSTSPCSRRCGTRPAIRRVLHAPAVVQFMVAVVDPRLGETVLDPACGTGGFLVEAFEHLKKQCKTVEDQQAPPAREPLRRRGQAAAVPACAR